MQDIDKLEKLAKGLKGIIKTGEKIMEDGKVDFSDSQYAQELFDGANDPFQA